MWSEAVKSRATRKQVKQSVRIVSRLHEKKRSLLLFHSANDKATMYHMMQNSQSSCRWEKQIHLQRKTWPVKKRISKKKHRTKKPPLSSFQKRDHISWSGRFFSFREDENRSQKNAKSALTLIAAPQGNTRNFIQPPQTSPDNNILTKLKTQHAD